MNDYSFAAVLAATLVASTYLIGKVRPERVNSVLFHNLSWAFALAVYSLHWIAYTDVSVSAWTLLVLGISSFNVGALVVSVLGTRERDSQSLQVTPLTWAPVALPLLFSVGLVFYLHAVAVQFGLGALIHSAASVRTFQGTDGFGIAFPLYGRVLYFLGPLVFVVYANPWLSGIRCSRRVQVVVLTYTFIGLSLSLGRTLLLVALVWQATILYLRPRRRVPADKVRRFAVVVVLAIFVVIAFQALALLTHKDGAADQRIQPYTLGPLRGKAFTSIVSYASGGFPSFSELTKEGLHGNYAYGKATLGPITKTLPTLHPPNQVGAFVSIPFPSNAYTWLETYYRDFGPTGCVALPFIMGFLVARLIGVRRYNSESLLIAALVLGLCVWAPLVNQYPSTFTWEYIVILGISIRRRRSVRRPSVQWIDSPERASSIFMAYKSR